MSTQERIIKSPGPPMDPQAALIIAGLDDEKLYTAAMVAGRGINRSRNNTEYQRLRRNFNRFVSYHRMAADGFVGKYAAWKGSHWKETLRPQDLEKAHQSQGQSEVRPLRFFRFLRSGLFRLASDCGAEQHPHWRKLSSALIGLSVLTLGIFGAIAARWPPAQTGYWILNHEGPGQAYKYFLDLGRSSDSNESIMFRYAWAAYRNQKYDVAERICLDLLSNPSNELVLANARYLLGCMNSDRGETKAARTFLIDALELYQSQNIPRNLQRCLMALAKLAILTSDFQSASFFLGQAEACTEGNAAWAYFYRMQSWLAFKTADYRSALDFSRKGLEITPEEASKQGEALSGLAFYLMLVGQFEEGMETTQRAEIEIIEAFDPRHYYFNLLNNLLYQRCNGQDYEVVRKAIEDFAIQQKDKMLVEYLEFVLEFTCPPVTEKPNSE